MGNCLLCASNSIINRQDSASRTIYNCPRCGVFVVSDVAVPDVMVKADEIAAYLMRRKLSNAKDTVLISYEKSKLDKDYLQLTADRIADLFPGSFAEQMDMALQNMALMSGFPGDEVRLDDLKMAPLFYVRKARLEALTFIIKCMQRADLIEVNYYGSAYFPCGVTVSPKGWERIGALQRHGTVRRMIFSCPPRNGSEMGALFNKTVEKLAEDFGFHLVNNFSERSDAKVTNELTASVKSAAVVVCDLTDHLGGAYYAAGLAAGLRKPCLLTCHVSARKKLQVDESQRSVIFWETQEGLYLELLNAARARDIAIRSEK